MTEILLFSVAVLAASVVVMWCERNRLERQIASLQNELAEAKVDAIKSVEEFTEMQNKMRESCLQVINERDQLKKDYNYVRNALWGECETSSELRHSRAVIIDHCRKLKRAIGHDRFAHKIEIDCTNDKITELTKERDHARKLMDETRERCGAEIDVLEGTIRYLGHYKTLAENRAKQIVSENEYWCTVNNNLRQSRQKIIDHCRLLKRKQKKLMAFSDYILEELTAINTYR